MGVIIVPEQGKKFQAGERIGIDGMELPDFRHTMAKQYRTDKNILIRSPFALGDCICAEPAIRFAAKYFVNCDVSIRTPFPEVFRHIPNIKKVYTAEEQMEWGEFNVFDCYHPADALNAQFVHNFNMAIEDYICVSLFKGMIPVADRNILLAPSDADRAIAPPQQVVIHAGKHWVSKTFPKKWWDLVIHHLLARGVKPILIGAKLEGGKRGYVDVDPTHCIDWRDKLTIMQSVAVLQNAKVVLTNDSAPYHMACSSDPLAGEDVLSVPHVGVFSTVRHPDFIGHWRPVHGKNEWNYKVKNLAKGQMWQNTDVCPGKNGGKYDVIDHATLMSWLPAPDDVAAWTMSKLNQ